MGGSASEGHQASTVTVFSSSILAWSWWVYEKRLYLVKNGGGFGQNVVKLTILLMLKSNHVIRYIVQNLKRILSINFFHQILCPSFIYPLVLKQMTHYFEFAGEITLINWPLKASGASVTITFVNYKLVQKKVSEIQTVWKWDASELSEIQTSSDFRQPPYNSLSIKALCSVKNQNLNARNLNYARIRTDFSLDFSTNWSIFEKNYI